LQANFDYFAKKFLAKRSVKKLQLSEAVSQSFSNFSKSWGISSRLSAIGIQIALEKPIERIPPFHYSNCEPSELSSSGRKGR
jgi:hypothetical protein